MADKAPNRNKKGQHWLLDPRSRTLTLREIWALTDEEAAEMFAQMRWAETNGAPVCPRCLNEEKIYNLSGVGQFKCSACNHKFSVTSGTVFAYHKKDLQDYLCAILLFVNHVKGNAALEMCRNIGLSYKAAFVLVSKIREAVHRGEMEFRNEPLDGVVEADGAYFGLSVRPANKKENRIDRRKNPSENKKCVLTVRERGQKGEGAARTKTFVIDYESRENVNALIESAVEAHAEMHTDGSGAYDLLESYFRKVSRINHSIAYSLDGSCTNQAESFFARFKRC